MRLTLKIGGCLAILYLTGIFWVPLPIGKYLYMGPAERMVYETHIRKRDAVRAKCNSAPSAEAYTACHDKTYEETL